MSSPLPAPHDAPSLTVRVLGREQVRALLPMDACIAAMRHALAQTAQPGATLQLSRLIMDLPDPLGACVGLMAGSMRDPDTFGVKVTSVFPGNFGTGYQSHQGLVTLFERAHGRPVGIVHGGEITARRTAAASAVATDVLARRDCRVLTILGYGEQGAMHAEAIPLVRNIQEIRVWGRDPRLSTAFAKNHARRDGPTISAARTLAEAVHGADIICTTTAAPTPFLDLEHISHGCHLNVVGASVARFHEVTPAVVAASRLYVDHLPMALAEAGEIRAAIAEGLVSAGHILGEIGTVVAGHCVGRTSPADVTLYKSLGMPVEDLSAAMHVLRRAEQLGVGTTVAF